MLVATVSIPDFSRSVFSMFSTNGLTPSPPDVAAFHAGSASGVKFIKSVELFIMKIALSVLGILSMWHLSPTAAAFLTLKARP